MKLPGDAPLGKTTEYPDTYSPKLLFPVARSIGRESLNIKPAGGTFFGFDRWSCFELSWLSANGCPNVAIAEFDFSCESLNIIESKSFKLYLNSFNQTVTTREELVKTLVSDLQAVCQGKVDVRLFDVEQFPVIEPDGFHLIDTEQVVCKEYEVNADLLALPGSKNVTEKLKSHVFRSLCPVTAQPDWASIYISYTGTEICQKSLLAYLVSFRKHQGFHEQCVEMIFKHLQERYSLSDLTVFARFLRRGGLDINPIRSTGQKFLNFSRVSRQ